MIGKIVNAGLALAKTTDLPNPGVLDEQASVLRRLMYTARKTAFGKRYQFSGILKEQSVQEIFANAVPPTEYEDFYREWWQFSREDQPDITWPGIIPYYALSSGTSGASSKYIPVSQALLNEMKKGSRRMFFDLSKYKFSAGQLRRQMLMVGSCTSPQVEQRHLVGDLSGIIGMNRPLWLSKYYRPGRHITDLPDWSGRIEAIAREACKWDIGFVVGNPAWVQLIFEKVMDRYGLQHIHQIWPNLCLYVHGGVFFELYRINFEQLLGKPLHYLDSYMASEGFFAYQNRPGSGALRLMTDVGIYYEFVPMNANNFDDNGNLLKTAKALKMSEIAEGVPYALLISTCAGAWRYLIGDTLEFTDLSRSEFKLTGRTKQFLSVCGEHLSIDNLNEAIKICDQKLNAGVSEFAVAAVPGSKGWIHQWYVSLKNEVLSPSVFAAVLDEALCQLNDDYAIERQYALQGINVEFLPKDLFYKWLHQKGKMNGQAKIPRVLKGETLAHWQAYLKAALV
jgi:hypothetical protein